MSESRAPIRINFSGELVVVPAGRKHGFSNTGNTVLRIQSTLAEPVFEAAYDDKRETPRRYPPDPSD